MAKSRKKKLVVLWLVFLTLVFVANLVFVTMKTGFKKPEEQECFDKIPKMEITLAETTLEELNSGSKEVKYSGNNVKISTCGEIEEYNGVEIKGRGNSTWGQPKNPYQIKFSEKEDLFGMGKARKWVLLANYLDDSNLRTDVAFYFERLLGEKYALNGEFIKLSINDEELGLYYLTPKVEIGKSRVDLRDPMGILVELDNLRPEDEYFSVDGNNLQFKDIVADDNIEAAEKDFADSLKKIAKAVKKKDLNGLSKLVDIESMVRYYLLSEFTINPDAYSSSFFMYKDGPDDVIHFGPGWDFDYGLGNKKWIWALKDDYYSPFEMSIIQHNSPALSKNIIWLVDSSEFFELVGEMYREKLMGRKEEVLSYLDDQADYIWEVAIDDAVMWEQNFVEEYDYLREWLSNRFDFFDEYFGGMGELDKHML